MTKKARAKKKTRIPQRIKTAVLRRDNNRCQYPVPRGICGSIEKLCIHDTTFTGEHKRVSDCLTICEMHHNQITGEHKHAQTALKRLHAQLRQYGTEQTLLYEP